MFYRCTEEASKQRAGKKVGTLVALGGIGHPQPSPPPLRDKSRKTRLYKGAATHPPSLGTTNPRGWRRKRSCGGVGAFLSPQESPTTPHPSTNTLSSGSRHKGLEGSPPLSHLQSHRGKSPPSYCLVVVVFVARLKRRRSITLE